MPGPCSLSPPLISEIQVWSDGAGALASAPAPAAGVRVTITLPPPSPLSPILPEPGLVSVSPLRWRGSHPEPEHVVTEIHRGASGARSDHCDKVMITLWAVTHHLGGGNGQRRIQITGVTSGLVLSWGFTNKQLSQTFKFKGERPSYEKCFNSPLRRSTSNLFV